MSKFDEAIKEWQEQVKRFNECESDWDMCPHCNEQLFFCSCHEELAHKALLQIFGNGKDGSEAVIVSRVYLESLVEDSDTLAKLEAYGVDNWSGYSDALRDSEGYFEEEEEE